MLTRSIQLRDGAFTIPLPARVDCYLLISALFASAPTAHALDRFVSPAGANLPPHTNWATAAWTIQAALDEAQVGDTVWVTNGVYDTGGAALPGSMVSNRVLVGPAIRLESVNGPDHTIIVGDQENIFQGSWPIRGVYLSTGATVVGFTITNGFARGASINPADEMGGGVYAETGTVENCLITGCSAGQGGGAANADLTDCRIIGNTAQMSGGGATRGTLVRCRVENNTTLSGVGGGIAHPDLVLRCWIQGNQASGSGGGIYGGITPGAVLHSFVLNNEAQYGGGISGDHTFNRIVVRNCTIMNNNALSSGGGYEHADIYDSIVYYNTAPSAPNYVALPNGSVIAPEDGPFVFSTNAPGIVSLANPRLLASSIAIDADTDPTLPAVDFEGDARPQGSAEDLGADEFTTTSLTGPLSVQITPSASSALTGQPITFEVAVSGLAIGYTVDLDDGTTLADQVMFFHAYASAGTYDVVVTASNISGAVAATATVSIVAGGTGTTYVSPVGSHTPPFTSWATAATNIQDAVDAAPLGGLVLVADGVYDTGSRAGAGGLLNRVVIDKNVTVKSDNGPAAAIIRGAWSGPGTNPVRAVYLGGGASLSGFTIEGGSVDTEGFGPPASLTSGGGIYAASSSHLVSNCVIRNNRAFLGAGVALANLVHCRIESNSASYGGGLYGGTADRCDLVNNTAGMEGGGALSPNSLTRSRISGNIAGWAGGGLVSADNVIGCLISGNWSRRAGGTFNSTLVRCTVSGNTAQNFAGGMQGGSATDSIVYHNLTTVSANHIGTGLANCYTVPAPTGNFSADPMLVSPINGHLLPGSPCMDAAGVSGLGTDLDGDAVPSGAAEDIGADEFNGAATPGPLSLRLAVSAVQALAGNALTFNIEVEGIASGLSLNLGDGQTVSSQSIVVHAYGGAGTYIATGTATNGAYSASASVTVQVSAADTILYVAPGGGHTPPFATWANASTTIQAAVDIAPEGATVLVSNGVYVSGGRNYPGTAHSNVVIATNGVHIRSVNGPEVTVIGRTNQVFGRGAFLGAGSSLQGFTVRNFKSRPPGSDLDLEMAGGGIYCSGPDIYVRNCIIQGNRAETWGGGVNGGIIEDSLIISNTAGYIVTGGGGGANGSTLHRCRVAYNEATWGTSGGGLSGSAAYDSIIEYNKATGSGAGTAHSTVDRCIVCYNQGSGTHGAGSLVRSSLIHHNTGAGCSYGYIINSTVVGNQGGGVWYGNVTNSILYLNTPSNHYALIRVRSSCTTPMPAGAIDVIVADPLFHNAAGLDFRLATNSPCINAGTNYTGITDTLDLDGNPRIQQGTVDMGAYEYPSYSSNGVLRAWLRSQGLPDDGTADELDFDDDTFNTRDEWLAGTSALDAQSALAFGLHNSAPIITEEGVVLRWPSVEGRTYRIMCASDLVAGFTQVVATGIAATPPMNSYSFPPVASPSAIYRIEVE